MTCSVVVVDALLFPLFHYLDLFIYSCWCYICCSAGWYLTLMEILLHYLHYIVVIWLWKYTGILLLIYSWLIQYHSVVVLYIFQYCCYIVVLVFIHWYGIVLKKTFTVFIQSDLPVTMTDATFSIDITVLPSHYIDLRGYHLPISILRTITPTILRASGRLLMEAVVLRQSGKWWAGDILFLYIGSAISIIHWYSGCYSFWLLFYIVFIQPSFCYSLLIFCWATWAVLLRCFSHWCTCCLEYFHYL